MKSRSDSQLTFGPAVVATSSQPEPERTICSDPAELQAAQLFDEALNNAGISSKEVAHLFGISRSLVDRMRSPNYRAGVSFTQMLRLPPAFHLELVRAVNRKFGFGRQALLELLDVVGRLAVGQ